MVFRQERQKGTKGPKSICHLSTTPVYILDCVWDRSHPRTPPYTSKLDFGRLRGDWRPLSSIIFLICQLFTPSNSKKVEFCYLATWRSVHLICGGANCEVRTPPYQSSTNRLPFFWPSPSNNRLVVSAPSPRQAHYLSLLLSARRYTGFKTRNGKMVCLEASSNLRSDTYPNTGLRATTTKCSSPNSKALCTCCFEILSCLNWRYPRVFSTGAIKRSKLEGSIAEPEINFERFVEQLDAGDSFTTSLVEILVKVRRIAWNICLEFMYFS